MRVICAVVGGYNLIFKPRKLGQGFWFCHVNCATLGYLVNLYEPQFLDSKIRTRFKSLKVVMQMQRGMKAGLSMLSNG